MNERPQIYQRRAYEYYITMWIFFLFVVVNQICRLNNIYINTGPAQDLITPQVKMPTSTFFINKLHKFLNKCLCNIKEYITHILVVAMLRNISIDFVKEIKTKSLPMKYRMNFFQ